MSKVLLSGIVVLLLAALLPSILPLLSGLLGGLDYSWLTDGDITLGELLKFLGFILIAISGEGRQVIKAAFIKTARALRLVK